jgi:hypothetical protein
VTSRRNPYMHPSQHRRVQLAGIRQYLGGGYYALPQPPLIWRRRVLTLACLCLDIVRFALRQEREGVISVGQGCHGVAQNEGLLEEEEVE